MMQDVLISFFSWCAVTFFGLNVFFFFLFAIVVLVRLARDWWEGRNDLDSRDRVSESKKYSGK